MTTRDGSRWPVDELVRRLWRGAEPAGLPDGWAHWPEAAEAHLRMARTFVESAPSYPPGRFRGRGVVVCGGGRRYFPCAWVCVAMLRHLGCDLPVQLWHLGGREVDDRMRELMAGLGVSCVDAEALREEHPARILRGWELKAYALLHSPFEEVLLLDADNVPVADPSPLFDAPEYRDAGAAFWPDFERLAPDRSAWKVTGVPHRDEPEVESGQVLVDKGRCWPALQLAMHYNEHSDFYYRHMHGDKETFHLAFRRLDAPYAMPSRPVEALPGCMCQHDFRGLRLFQHRNMDKWRLDGSNRRIEGFRHEDLCRAFLAELRALWSDSPSPNLAPDATKADAERRLAGKRFLYRRPGHDERPLGLERGGSIGEGRAATERSWTVNKVDGRPMVSLLGEDAVTCRLVEEAGVWRGRGIDRERTPVELHELP